MISTERLEEIVNKCLFKDSEIVDGKPILEPVVGKGIVRDFGFHPLRLLTYKTEVMDMLKQLPDSFMESKGGGMSSLNACMTKDGEQWGEHTNMEQLFALGNAMGIVKYPMPKDMWHALPGGMPYVTIIDKEKNETTS